MKYGTLSSIAVLSFAALVSLTAADASAEPQPNPPAPPPKAQLTPVDAEIMPFIGKGFAGTSATGHFLLSGFSLNYLNGDHKVRKLAVGPDGATGWNGALTARIGDHELEDPWAAHVWGVVVNDNRIEDKIETAVALNPGNGNAFDCLFAVGQRQGFRFAVRGFDFEYLNGDDHHFNSIKIEYNREHGTVFARMRDQNWDDNVRCTLQYAWVPEDILVGGNVSIDAAARSSRFDEGRNDYPALAGGRGVFFSNMNIGYVSGDNFVERIKLDVHADTNVFHQLKDNDANEAYAWHADMGDLR